MNSTTPYFKIGRFSATSRATQQCRSYLISRENGLKPTSRGHTPVYVKERIVALRATQEFARIRPTQKSNFRLAWKTLDPPRPDCATSVIKPACVALNCWFGSRKFG